MSLNVIPFSLEIHVLFLFFTIRSDCYAFQSKVFLNIKDCGGTTQWSSVLRYPKMPSLVNRALDFETQLPIYQIFSIHAFVWTYVDRQMQNNCHVLYTLITREKPLHLDTVVLMLERYHSPRIPIHLHFEFVSIFFAKRGSVRNSNLGPFT